MDQRFYGFLPAYQERPCYLIHSLPQRIDFVINAFPFFLLRIRKKGHRPPDRAHFSTIEHGEFLQALRRLRRELLKKPKGNTSGKTNDGQRSLVGGCGPESSTSTTSSSLPTLSLRRNYSGTTSRGEKEHSRQNLQRSMCSRDCSQANARTFSYWQQLGFSR